jgi:SAM-dependent methyltransferase
MGPLTDTQTVSVKPIKRKAPSLFAAFADILGRIVGVAFAMAAILSLLFFPWSTDGPLTQAERADLQKFYSTAYDKPVPEEKEDTRYVKIAEEEANRLDVTGIVSNFAHTFGLEDKKVLDIGSGRGYLQDVVADYTGLDISPSVRRFYHKPLVVASATLMPLATNQFDAAWSIWVFEHVPNPEAGLEEMRRVTKDGGLLYLAPAWDCTPWAADGYTARPYSDFGIAGKLYKASIPLHIYFRGLAKPAVRMVRYLAWSLSGEPTRLHYTHLKPNYDYYWVADSDAVNSLDRYETALWFISRGDQCLNCEGNLHGLMKPNEPLIVRVNKKLPAH